MTQFQPWKYWLVIAVLALGAVLALPNIYGQQWAMQVAYADRKPMDAAAEQQVLELLKAKNVPVRDSQLIENRLIVRLNSEQAQPLARDAVREGGKQFSVALSKESAAPWWMLRNGLKPMTLGLDLRGGVRLMYEVDVKGAIKQYVDRMERNVRSTLREKRIPYSDVDTYADSLRVTLRSSEQAAAAATAIQEFEPDAQITQETGADGPAIVVKLAPATIQFQQDQAIEQNLITLRNRVNELGVSEPVVVRQGKDRIVVQLPGLQDANQAIRVLGATTSLEWHMVDTANDAASAELSKRVPLGSRLYKERSSQRPILLKRELIVSGSQMEKATAGTDEDGRPSINVQLDARGGDVMLKNTQQNIRQPMAVLSIEKHRMQPGEQCRGVQVGTDCTVEDVIQVATIQGVFGRNFQITGLTPTEASETALLLRAGSLAAPIFLVNQGQVGPSLGQDNIDNGILAMVIGMGLTFAFITFYYRWFGLVACAVLTANVVLLTAVMSLIGGVLTLPGIAGIVLTVGMAADANVLIYERIREELRIGNSPQAAIHAGFDKAFSAIADSNITTLIAGVVLFALGSGPIKGFAVTLVIGIATSLFTAILGSRALIQAIWGNRRQLAALPV
jgi:preprotein translocase subunit SecD